MLKKLILIITLIVTTIPLYSCGEDTRDWPRFSFPFVKECVYKVRVYHEKQNVVTCFETIDEDDLDFLYRCNTFIYKEQKESEKNLENYYIKLEFTYFLKNYSLDYYKITFYNKGILNGYVVFNDEIHFDPEDIESFYIYSIKDMGENE